MTAGGVVRQRGLPGPGLDGRVRKAFTKKMPPSQPPGRRGSVPRGDRRGAGVPGPLSLPPSPSWVACPVHGAERRPPQSRGGGSRRAAPFAPVPCRASSSAEEYREECSPSGCIRTNPESLLCALCNRCLPAWIFLF